MLWEQFDKLRPEASLAQERAWVRWQARSVFYRVGRRRSLNTATLTDSLAETVADEEAAHRKETLEELSRSKDHGADLIKGADKAVVVIADTLIADTWIEDSSIALTYMHLMATELGLGSCWVQIHLRSRDGVDSEGIVRDILKIDDHYRIVGILALGHSDDIPDAHTLDDIDKNKIHFLV